jgi:hypothetical protein
VWATTSNLIFHSSGIMWSFIGVGNARRCLACFFSQLGHGVERDESLRYGLIDLNKGQ